MRPTAARTTARRDDPVDRCPHLPLARSTPCRRRNLHRVHESGVSGQFFARTVAANNYDRATTQLQEKAALSNSDATTIISKLRAAQLDR